MISIGCHITSAQSISVIDIHTSDVVNGLTQAGLTAPDYVSLINACNDGEADILRSYYVFADFNTLQTRGTVASDTHLYDSVNALRQAAGSAPVTLNAQLTAAAATHSRDMSVQNRPWHFGSDGSSPLLRAQRVGFRGRFLGELISETFETELQTISAWMKDPSTRSVLLDPAATLLGFAWFQEPNGKIWWTLMTGT
jgi:uncharacterized protein YkwD